MSNVTVTIPPMSEVAIGFGPMVTGIMLQQLFLGVLSEFVGASSTDNVSYLLRKVLKRSSIIVQIMRGIRR